MPCSLSFEFSVNNSMSVHVFHTIHGLSRLIRAGMYDYICVLCRSSITHIINKQTHLHTTTAELYTLASKYSI